MNLKLCIFSIVCCMFASVSNAASYDYNFGVLPSGTHVTTLPGVTFSLGGGGVTAGSPTVTDGGLTNSSVEGYPTADWLVADFNSPVDNVSFNFDNQGDNSSHGGTTWSAFSSNNVLLGSGSLATANGGLYSLLGLSGISRIVWDNNLTDGRKNWIFVVKTLKFNEVSAVPLPPAALLFAPALLGFLGLRRKTKSAV